MAYEALFGLIGFFIGVVLHLFLLSVVVRRRKKKKDSLGQILIYLLGALLIWYSGNFIALLLRQMNVGKVALIVESVDVISFTGLSLLPGLLLHTHWVYYRRAFQPSQLSQRLVTILLSVLYGQLLLLPVALFHLVESPAISPLQKLGPFRLPFLILLALSYFGSCAIQLRILQRSHNRIEREVFGKLIILFLVIPLFNFWVFALGGAQSDHGGLWLNLALMASLFPTFVVAYYIYRHEFLQITVHRSIASAFLILVIITAYLAGIRGFGQYLEEELDAPPLLLEATFLIALLLFFPPLSRWLETWVSRVFAREIHRYRELAGVIGRASPHFLSPATLKVFLENKLGKELPNVAIQLHLDKDVPEGKNSVYPLISGDSRIGYLEAHLSEEEDSPGQREGLRLLANEMTVLLERARFLETQLHLKRELAEKSHLEDLGRMAAAIAHNVKNPLSSIKTLLQLLSEERNLTNEQVSEIEMMIQEVDRLSKTVSTLLSFSRLDQIEEKSPARDLVNPHQLLSSIQGIFRGDLKSRNVSFEVQVVPSNLRLRSDADILNDILSNLISNALEASPRGGTIRVRMEGTDKTVRIQVEDDGAGIPAKLRKRVLEPFYTTKARGTGLGLAIVSRRVEQLGGELSIGTTSKKQGTQVLIQLPVDPSLLSLEQD
jgi:signal transduction histidine kinase